MKKPLNKLISLISFLAIPYSQTNSKKKLQKLQKIAVFLTFGNLPNQNFLEGMNLGVH